VSYYQGDFYRAPRGLAKGDPGFFSFIKGIASGAASFIPGVGPVISKGLSMIPGGGGAVKSAVEVGRGAIVKAGSAIVKHPVLSAAGAAGAIGAVGLGRHLMAGGHRCRHGTHISKRTGAEVCNRRMNPCNPRALRRAIRRTHSFAKLAMKAIHIIHPKKKGRFGGFKMKRKRK